MGLEQKVLVENHFSPLIYFYLQIQYFQFYFSPFSAIFPCAGVDYTIKSGLGKSLKTGKSGETTKSEETGESEESNESHKNNIIANRHFWHDTCFHARALIHLIRGRAYGNGNHYQNVAIPFWLRKQTKNTGAATTENNFRYGLEPCRLAVVYC